MTADDLEPILRQILASQQQIIARLDAMTTTAAPVADGPSRTDDGRVFLPGTGVVGTSVEPDDAPPVDKATGLATIHALRDARTRHPANPQEPGA